MAADSNPKKRGLVLEGGGAKAAYAFGCLTALRERGMHFDAVSGTSAGALNAVLWSSSQMDFGARFWTTISRRKVRRSRLPTLLAPWLIAPQFLARAQASEKSARPDGVDPVGIVSPRLSWTSAILGTAIAALDVAVGTPLGEVIVAPIVVFLWLPCVWLIVQRFGHWQRGRRLSVFSTDPLRDVIERCLTGCELQIPTYVCMTESANTFDPDDPRDQRPRWRHFPRYVELSRRNTAERISALVASTALPYGLFPAARFDDREVTDGGLSDNVPVFPLVTEERCDEIVVVRLAPRRDEDDQFYVHEWQRIERAARLRQIEPAHALAMADILSDRLPFAPEVKKPNYPPKILPVRQPHHWPTRLVTLAPSRPLGLFVTGTLRFSSAYTKILIEMGRRETHAAIAIHWPVPGPPQVTSP